MEIRSALHAEVGEAWLSRYFQNVVSSRLPPHIVFALHPVRTIRAIALAHRLPGLDVDPSRSAEGQQLRAALKRQSKALGWSPLHRLTAVLQIPRVPEQYTAGPAKQTLRRRSRASEKLGIRWSRVDRAEERMALLILANKNERTFPRKPYRHVGADHQDLLDCRLWLAAYTTDGRPLLLSVTAVDKEWALLSYFRVLGTGTEHSNSRYYMMPVLVQQLTELGVSHLFDEGSPVRLPGGLRQYQRSIGFRIMQVRVHGGRRRGQAGL